MSTSAGLGSHLLLVDLLHASLLLVSVEAFKVVLPRLCTETMSPAVHILGLADFGL